MVSTRAGAPVATAPTTFPELARTVSSVAREHPVSRTALTRPMHPDTVNSSQRSIFNALILSYRMHVNGVSYEQFLPGRPHTIDTTIPLDLDLILTPHGRGTGLQSIISNGRRRR